MFWEWLGFDTKMYHSLNPDPESNDSYVSSSTPGGGTGDEVCRLWLRLVLTVENKITYWCAVLSL